MKSLQLHISDKASHNIIAKKPGFPVPIVINYKHGCKIYCFKCSVGKTNLTVITLSYQIMDVCLYRRCSLTSLRSSSPPLASCNNLTNFTASIWRLLRLLLYVGIISGVAVSTSGPWSGLGGLPWWSILLNGREKQITNNNHKSAHFTQLDTILGSKWNLIRVSCMSSNVQLYKDST